MFAHRLNERHSLRQLTLNDTAELFAVVDANRAYLRQWLPWLDMTRSISDTRHFLDGSVQQCQNNHSIQAAILFEGRLAGVVGYHRIDWQNRSTLLGYWIAEKFQGRGLVTTSCRVLIDHAFASLNLHRIAITCATGNLRSRAIAERLGFTHEGRHRGAEWLYDHFIDHEVYSQLQKEWEARVISRMAESSAQA